MRRFLFNALTLLSLLLCALALMLWVRAQSRFDVIVVRTAPSYTAWPNLKRVVLSPQDGWVLAFHHKVVPGVEGSPAWRDDVPLSALRLMAPVAPWARPLSEAQHREYEAAVAPEFRRSPVLQWQSHASAQRLAPPGRRPLPPAPRVGPTETLWNRLGFRASSGVYVIGNENDPGAYRDYRVRLPHGFVVGAAAALPVLWVALWLWRRARAKRVGLCPGCGYDLRGTPDRCPECGRPVTDGEARQAGLRREADASASVGAGTGASRPRRYFSRPRWRRVLLAGGAAAACVLLVAWLARDDRVRPGGTTSAEVLGYRRELATRLDDVAREIARLRAAGDAAGADALEAQLRPFRDAAAGKAAATGTGPEVHAVGVYEGMLPGGVQRGFRTHPVGSVAVEVRDTGRPIVLVLCAYEPVKWDVRVGPGARLEKVLLCGYLAQEATGVPPGVPVEGLTRALKSPDPLYAYKREDENFMRLERAVRELTGLPVSTFRGSYRYKDPPIVVGPGEPAWEVQRLLADLAPLHGRATAFERIGAQEAVRTLRFKALWQAPGREPFGGGNSIGDFDPTGPLAASLRPLPERVIYAAVDPAGPTCYGSDSHSLLSFDLATEKATAVPTDPKLPPLSWCAGLAFDTRRRQLAFASITGPASSIYRYAVDSGRWTLAPPIGRTLDLSALTYSEADDCYYGLAGATGEDTPSLVRISPAGAAEWRIPFPERLPGRGDAMRRPPQLVAVGDLLVAILPPPGAGRASGGAGTPPRCLVIDPKTNTVKYAGEMAPHDGGGAATQPGAADR